MQKTTLNTGDRPSLFPELCPISAAVELLAGAESEERGAIFTRKEVVDFILDLVGYTTARPLHESKILEPSFGHGDFLIPVVTRLLECWHSRKKGKPISSLRNAVRAVELHRESFEKTRKILFQLLQSKKVGKADAEDLLDSWLINGDFLLATIDGPFDFVVGNPPYVRQELISEILLAEYRRRYSTIYDRADLYIPFIERSLLSLVEKGKLGFICADRWMKNRYGGPLRELVSNNFRLNIYVDMVNTPAFHSDVIAYPAVTVISREQSGSTRVAYRPKIAADELRKLSKALLEINVDPGNKTIRELGVVTVKDEPWILEYSEQLDLVRRLERDYPSIEDAGCKVGIGVATGADKAFIGMFDELDVEPDRKLPLAMTRDIWSGEVKWKGYGIINPFRKEGGLVDLSDYPKLRRYLNDRKEIISGRHVAKNAPSNWYRTIDRIYPELAKREKLLIPDIKGEALVVFEKGKLYPHHNLYFITSDSWDLRALQAVLQSGIARLFVATYSTRMRGGFLRFQAQYLRRIRLPKWSDVPAPLKKKLVNAALNADIEACNDAAFKIYKLTPRECVAITAGEK